MKVFISWSGDLSKSIAEAVRDWLPGVLQAVRPFFTPNDIEKGARWASDIAEALKASDVGLFVITPENIEKPWIMFEAGAISREMAASRICVLMFGIETTDLKGPLTQFQATRFQKSDFKRLISNINDALGVSKLDSPVLDDVFDIWWPRIEKKISDILSIEAKKAVSKEIRDQKDILEEVLSLTRSIQREMNVGQNRAFVPVGAPAPIRYENSVHKIFIDAITGICEFGSNDNRRLDVIEYNLELLRAGLLKRSMINSLKKEINFNIDEIIQNIQAERDLNKTLIINDEAPEN